MISHVFGFERGVRNYRNDPYSSDSLGSSEEKLNHELDKPANCSDPEVLIKPVPFLDDQWKNRVIIGCTVAVALEVLIVLLMVMYWKQIRWTLRKLACPCDYFYRRQHEPMQRQEVNYETNIDLESDDSLSVDQEMQIYAPSSHSNFSAGCDERGGNPSSASHRYSHVGFPSDLNSKVSHYINDGDDDDYDDDADAGRTCSLGESSQRCQAPASAGTEQGNTMQVYAIVHNCTSNVTTNDT